MGIKKILFILAGLCLIQPLVENAQSCSVPVFRYSLERWHPEPYKGIYIYRNEISEEDQKLLEQIKDASRNDVAPLNLLIREVNADSFSKEKLTEILQGPIPDELPIFIIWYPGQMGKKLPFLQEKLTPSLVEGLIQSPKRKQMAESLINGESVVWVFIPSGNKDKDESAKTLIKQELDKAVQTYSKSPFTILSGNKRIKLNYGFPVMTVSRDEPSERVFLDMLLKSESDLQEYSDEPMVFPVFGRGRLLGCLFGEYITAKKINEATTFLSEACSCEVKDLNPGIDLLIAAPWDMVVMNAFVQDEPLPELTGVMPEPEETTANETPSLLSNIEPENNFGLFTISGVTLIAVMLVAGISGHIIIRRRNE